ncbi:MAG TPA: hypothetical protein VGL39_22585 [Jatrophihabitantaceae bacterium]|jgi:hypothetical protein
MGEPEDLLSEGDVSGSVTFDSDGHLRGADFYPPGRADGSDPLHWEPGQPNASPADPGWMPNQNQSQPPMNLNDLPPPDGFHWDPVTHVPVWNGAGDAAPEEPGPGDYPEPDPDTGYA